MTVGLGVFPPFAVWATSGLETMAFALLLFIVFERLVLREQRPDWVGGGVAGLLLALVRVEGIGWFMVVWLLAVLGRRLTGKWHLRRHAVSLAFVVVGFGVYYAWRWHYFENPLPNTVYAKAAISTATLSRGVCYTVSWFLTFLTPVVNVPGTVVAVAT